MPALIQNPAARRLFLDRHALAEAPAGPASGQALHDLIDRIGFVQVDSINTVARAHDMILWSRRQTYRPAALKRLLEHDRNLWEHWTHDASILPSRLHGVWQHRFARDAVRLEANWRKWFREGYEAQFDTILNRIAKDGPVGTSEVGEGEVRGRGGWWDWHPSKTALEWLWRTGQVAITRRDGFRKIYDLTERVIPAEHRNPVPEETVTDWACRSALDHLGFATPGEIAAYWNAVGPDAAKLWCRRALVSCHPSTPPCVIVTGQSFCSVSATGSRSLCLNRSGCSATMSFRSWKATAWSAALTPRRIGTSARCGSRLSGPRLECG
jgi:uncharacterized protein